MILKHHLALTSLMLIIATLNVLSAQSDDSLKMRLINKAESEDLLADRITFNNLSEFPRFSKPKEKVHSSNMENIGSMNLVLRFILTAPIRFHQKVITHQDGASCTFRPSCSQYGYEAIRRHGLLGLLMTSDRLLRCYRGNSKYYPTIGAYAYDPVPP